MKLLRCLLAPLAFFTSSLFAQVTITVTGTIGDRSGDAGFQSSFPLGTSFTATFTYDPATVDTDPLSTRAYYPNNTSGSATFSAGGYSFSAFGQPSPIEVLNNDSSFVGIPVDGFSFSFSGDASFQDGGFRPTSFGLTLLTDNVNLFSNDSLANITSGAWELDDLQYFILPVRNGFIGGNNLYGYASSFSVSVVPEPSTYGALAGLGALGLVCWRRRQASTVM